MNGTLLVGDCRETLRTLPDQSVHCVVTSPPYFGLRDYGHDDQIGLEATPDEFVAAMVEIFREVHRVLRDDGTFWLNLGDSYAANRTYHVPSTKGGPKHGPAQGVGGSGSKVPEGLKPKDLIGIPWRVAFALQADGWYLRQDIIWHKPNPMPESVRDRCTKAHEYIFMLTKQPRYYFDSAAMQEDATCNRMRGPALHPDTVSTNGNDGLARRAGDGKRNRRSVWTVTTKPFKGAHFATFPPDLIEPCVLAGCPAQCCSVCGAAAVPQYTRGAEQPAVDGSELDRFGTGDHGVHRKVGGQYQKWLDANPKRLTGHKRSCTCDAPTVPGTVLDPFFGAGTTGLVAQQHNRKWIGCELNPEYAAIARRRLGHNDGPLSEDDGFDDLL